jgi:hypothetical protein
MSATPHNGEEADFQLFMGLLDADRFEGRFREGVHKADVSTIDLCQSGPIRVSEAIKEVYYEHRKESCSHHRRVARYRCGPRQGIS